MRMFYLLIRLSLQINRNLNYNWHRFYRPELGQYISPDPIGLAGGINMYSYVGANPINYIDPMGLEKKSFGDRWVYYFQKTNDATISNRVIRSLIGIPVSKEYGALTQSRSLLSWARGGFSGYRSGAAVLTGLEAGVVGLGHTIFVAGIVLESYEVGVAIGSGINASIDIHYENHPENVNDIYNQNMPQGNQNRYLPNIP